MRNRFSAPIIAICGGVEDADGNYRQYAENPAGPDAHLRVSRNFARRWQNFRRPAEALILAAPSAFSYRRTAAWICAARGLTI